MMNKKIKIALIGYGTMGHEIEKIALSQGHTIVAIIDNAQDWKTRLNDFKLADVAMEFTTPDTAYANIEKCFSLGIPVVSGTTGWSGLSRIKETCVKFDGTLFHASNFSLGVNIYFELNRKLARILSSFEDYVPHITETHHIRKLDSPSGTAVVLANDIVTINPRLSRWVLSNGNVAHDELSVKAIRLDDVPGTHVISYYGPDDSIEIKHTAHNRSGFAQGALMAAIWVTGRKGVYSMKDLLKL